MSNQEQLGILRQGVEAWNRWRAENRGVAIDLSKALLKKANLRSYDLYGADMHGADLSGADLAGAHLTQADLRRAHLQDAFLWGVNLSRCNLRGAELVAADLRGANLRGAELLGASFLSAIAQDTTFGNSDMSGAIGLADMRHLGPSSISTDAFALSRGRIPEVFLQGCGLSDWEIELVKLYNPDLSNNEFIDIQSRIFELSDRRALQISHLFISYSHADGIFVDKLEGFLTKNGVRFWRDVHDAKAGRLEKQIDRAMRLNPTVLLVLSEHSTKSDWVEHEVREARTLEKEMGRDVLCPVALDDSWKTSPWPKRVMEQVMEYNILDFSAWQDDAKFDTMFRKLLEGVRLFYEADGELS